MAITEDEYRALLPDMPDVRTSSESAAVLTADEYFKVVHKPDTRPALWKWADVKASLDALGREPLREAERRLYTTVNTDTGELTGATPFTFIGWQLIHPGEEVPPHRHNSMAIYHILQGSGYTAVQSGGTSWAKYHWEKGDILACPAWAYHAHYAEGSEDTLMYVVQDMPMLAASRTLFWRSPSARSTSAIRSPAARHPGASRGQTSMAEYVRFGAGSTGAGGSFIPILGLATHSTKSIDRRFTVRFCRCLPSSRWRTAARRRSDRRRRYLSMAPMEILPANR